MITNRTVADRLTDYLNHKIGLDDLVDWAENALLEGEFDPSHATELATAVARLGVADVRHFGLTWEDCDAILHGLGFDARVALTPGSMCRQSDADRSLN